MEYPSECLNCGWMGEDENLIRYSLDAYAGPDDYDIFCPACDSDEIRLHTPKEDKHD